MLSQPPVLVEVELLDVAIEETTEAFVMFLKEVNGNRILPIWIGQNEGQSIKIALENFKVPRPLTHDLIKSIFLAFNAKVEKVVINGLKNSTYHARLILRQGKRLISIDARPSDAVAIAVRIGAPIFVVKEIMESSGVEPEKNQ
ncbi:MAG: bifunctional nuclease family protein [Candidatus Hydrothermota bacterium]|nr:MAG: bifunctional nuclease family protein [Candidatus Hydrothermae bacterium]